MIIMSKIFEIPNRSINFQFPKLEDLDWLDLFLFFLTLENVSIDNVQKEDLHFERFKSFKLYLITICFGLFVNWNCAN